MNVIFSVIKIFTSMESTVQLLIKVSILFCQYAGFVVKGIISAVKQKYSKLQILISKNVQLLLAKVCSFLCEGSNV